MLLNKNIDFGKHILTILYLLEFVYKTFPSHVKSNCTVNLQGKSKPRLQTNVLRGRAGDWLNRLGLSAHKPSHAEFYPGTP